MNRFFKGFGKGVSDYGPALSFIFKHNLGWFFLVPIVFNISLFIGGFAAISSLTDYIQAVVLKSTSLENANFFGAAFISGLLSFGIYIVLKIVFFFLFAYTGGYIVLILMSPFLAYLSEKTEKILTGKDYPFDIQQLMRDIVRGVLIALRNALIETLIIFLFFIVGIIPVIGFFTNLISPFVLLLIAAYFYGFSFVDYVNERQRYNIKQSVAFTRQNKGLITGNGFFFALILLIPYIGLLISGFIAIVAVVAAVISVKEIKDSQQISIENGIH
ncbi:MAG: EI24 domain-containing protein [Bacteroidales bacterium]|nr:EI24 domain-containing protein [Bacteroidales bacterium]